jgi:hypothetical protein
LRIWHLYFWKFRHISYFGASFTKKLTFFPIYDAIFSKNWRFYKCFASFFSNFGSLFFSKILAPFFNEFSRHFLMNFRAIFQIFGAIFFKFSRQNVVTLQLFGRKWDVQELPVSGGVVAGGVAVSGHHPLGGQQTFNPDRAPGVNPASWDSNLGSCKMRLKVSLHNRFFTAFL